MCVSQHKKVCYLFNVNVIEFLHMWIHYVAIALLLVGFFAVKQMKIQLLFFMVVWILLRFCYHFRTIRHMSLCE